MQDFQDRAVSVTKCARHIKAVLCQSHTWTFQKKQTSKETSNNKKPEALRCGPAPESPPSARGDQSSMSSRGVKGLGLSVPTASASTLSPALSHRQQEQGGAQDHPLHTEFKDSLDDTRRECPRNPARGTSEFTVPLTYRARMRD